MTRSPTYDVLVIGGGPAGLNAALLLARARRRVALCDHGRPRNAASHGVHGFLSRDGVLPSELLRLGREEARRYGVAIHPKEVRSLDRTAAGFEATLANGAVLRGALALLATGVRDHVPESPGMRACFGISVHHCPYCDGWEWSDRALAVYGRGAAGRELSHALLGWSHDVTLVSDGSAKLSRAERCELDRRGVRVEERPVRRLRHARGRLTALVFADGGTLSRDALFLATGNEQACGIASSIGCRLTPKGAIWTTFRQSTAIDGLYAAGDATHDAQFAIVAAAEGAKAAVAINTELLRRDRLRARSEAPAR